MTNKQKSEKGFLQLIICILIFFIFILTVCICLEILDVIEIPEKYSAEKWISDHISTINTDKLENTLYNNESKNVIIEIENKIEQEISYEKPLNINSYSSSKKTVSNEVMTNTDSFSYYNQLDDYAKIIYKGLEENLDNMKTGTYNVQFGTTFNDLLHKENGEEVLNNSFQLAVNALNFDNPETFYIDIPKLYLFTEIRTKLWVTTYSVEIGAREGENYLNPEFKNEEDVNNAIAKVRNHRYMIKSEAGQGTDESKIRAVHDYLIKKLEYDSSVSHDNIYNIYGALINELTVCEGYARTFKYIMDDMRIECIIACGTAINSAGNMENHAWNYVKLDGRWYAIDVTWDDPVIIGNGYIGNDVKYRYYLKGSRDFFANHTEDGNIVGDSHFKYPEISENNY